MTTVVHLRVPNPKIRDHSRVVNEAVKFCAIRAAASHALQKLAGDYLFNVTLTIQNVVDGSRWHVSRVSDGSVIDSGVQSGTGDIQVTVGYTGSPFNVRIKVRNASGATKYKPFETQAQITASGASTYIIQTED